MPTGSRLQCGFALLKRTPRGHVKREPVWNWCLSASPEPVTQSAHSLTHCQSSGPGPSTLQQLPAAAHVLMHVPSEGLHPFREKKKNLSPWMGCPDGSDPGLRSAEGQAGAEGRGGHSAPCRYTLHDPSCSGRQVLPSRTPLPLTRAPLAAPGQCAQQPAPFASPCGPESAGSPCAAAPGSSGLPRRTSVRCARPAA